MLDDVRAIGYFQLTFTDIDIANLTPPVPDNLGYFIYPGLVDIDLQSKPALAEWDKVFSVPFRE